MFGPQPPARLGLDALTPPGQSLLSARDYEVETAGDGRSARQIVAERLPNLIEVLIRRPGQLVRQTVLLREVWGPS